MHQVKVVKRDYDALSESGTRAGQVSGLPALTEGTTYIVSGMVLDALGGTRRVDVVAPDTGPDAIRENGNIVAVRGFVC